MSHFDRFPAEPVHPNAPNSGYIDGFYQDTGAQMLDMYLINAKLQQHHTSESHRTIMHAAGMAARQSEQQTRRALILGAGACIDIPLRDIVETFEQTTVVELDTDATESASARLPRRLRSKMQIVRADISGFVQPMGTLIDQAGREPTWLQFTEVLDRGIRSIDPVQAAPDLGRDYDFVCSHLVMSQMASMPLNYADSRAFAQYDKGIAADDEINLSASIPASPDESLHRFTEQAQLAHLDVLKRSVAVSGIVHFADTLFHIEGSKQIPLTTAAVEPGIEARFDRIGTERAWLWRPEHSRSLVVSQSILTPKQS